MVAMCLVAAANERFHSMTDEVNQHLAKNARIRATRWNVYHILGLHAEMYPNSPKRWQMWTLALTGFAFLFGGFFASSALPH